MAKVTFTKGRTVNLGNFESSRIDISVELESEDVDEAFVEAKAFVEARLSEELGPR